MDNRIKQVTSELSQVTVDAVAAFGGLSAAQLNWKPAEKSWSVAQCFDHLITTHSLYFPMFQRLEKRGVTPTLWERVSPLSGFFGRFLIKGMMPDNPKKMKTTSKAFPSNSEIGGDIIELFSEHQHQMIDHLQRLPADIDPPNTIITSPLLGLITYRLADTFTILVVHCLRHLGQAQRVTQTEGFPN
ncbi:MAG: DinB family protein [Pyrinomonadaceae bacterium]